MAEKHHIAINGSGFLIRPRSYSRQNFGGSTGGWQSWRQKDWQRGDRQPRQGDDGRWAAGYGVDSSRTGELGLGPVLTLSCDSGEMGEPTSGFSTMVLFGDRLVAGESAGGRLYTFDGTNWRLLWNTGQAAVRSMARFGSRLYVGLQGSPGSLYWFDPSTWECNRQFTVEGSVAVSALALYWIWDPASKATVQRLFLGCDMTDGGAKVYQWDESSTSPVEVYSCEERHIEAMVVYGGRLYVATSDTGNGTMGRILCFDGRSSSGDWSESLTIGDNYVAGWTTFEGLLYCGSGIGGKIWAFDGRQLAEAYDLSDLGITSSGRLRALAAVGGHLFVGYTHPTEGAAVLQKLPSAGLRTDDSGLSVESLSQSSILSLQSWIRLGWSTPSTTGLAGEVGSMASYGGALYLSRDAIGEGQIYRRDPSILRSSGQLDLSEFDGGDPGSLKALRRVVVAHAPLAAGQSITVRVMLDSTGSWQLLGSSNVVGTTWREMPFEAGATARRIALRVELSGAGGSDGPTVTGMALEYAAAVDRRREWRFEVRCEGVPGAMLPLLDGSKETRTGSQLSEALWAARGEGMVALEDLDGSTHTVWFEDLQEVLADLPQTAGAQTAARCRLVEC